MSGSRAKNFHGLKNEWNPCLSSPLVLMLWRVGKMWSLSAGSAGAFVGLMGQGWGAGGLAREPLAAFERGF